jgi:hypothetical protein
VSDVSTIDYRRRRPRIQSHRLRAWVCELDVVANTGGSTSSDGGGSSVSHRAVPSSPSLTVRRIASCARTTESANPLATRRRGCTAKPGLAAEMPMANPLAPSGGESSCVLRDPCPPVLLGLGTAVRNWRDWRGDVGSESGGGRGAGGDPAEVMMSAETRCRFIGRLPSSMGSGMEASWRRKISP